MYQNAEWISLKQIFFCLYITEAELKALKEEFQHHQDKVDQYYNLLNSASAKMENEQSKF